MSRRSRYSSQNIPALAPTRVLGFCIAAAAFFALGFYVLGPALRSPDPAERELPAPAAVAEPVVVPSGSKQQRSPVSAVEVSPTVSPTVETAQTHEQASEAEAVPDSDQQILPHDQPTVASGQSAPPPDAHQALYRVQAGAFSSKEGANRVADKLRAAGFNPVIISDETDDRMLHEVRVGTFRNKHNAEKVAEAIRAAGVESYIAQTQ